MINSYPYWLLVIHQSQWTQHFKLKMDMSFSPLGICYRAVLFTLTRKSPLQFLLVLVDIKIIDKSDSVIQKNLSDHVAQKGSFLCS